MRTGAAAGGDVCGGVGADPQHGHSRRVYRWRAGRGTGGPHGPAVIGDVVGLTDMTTLVTAWIVTGGLFVVTVAFTPRLTAPVVGVLARAALVLLTAVGLLVGVGLQLNGDNGWYVSWEDLAGAQAQAQVSTEGDTAAAAAAAPGRSQDATTAHASTERPPLPSPGTRRQEFTVTGDASHLTLPVSVTLPASYATSPTRRYPVLIAYHGYPGAPSGWTKTMRVGQTIDEQVAANRLAETIVVVPQINSPLSRDGECMDGPAGTPQLETWLTEDVPRFAKARLRTIEDRSAWATIGYSAGAYCSAVAGILHPETFGAAIVMGGYVRPDFADGPPVLPAGSAAAGRYDLVAAVRKHTPSVALWVQAGRQSPYWSQIQALEQAVRPPTSLTTVVEPDSGHRWSVWQARLPDALRWLGAEIPGFRPQR